MSSHRRRGAAAAISVLTLLAVAGWLQLILDDPGETAPIDGAALVGVVRAGVSVERLAEEPADPEAARRAQADLISAISLVPRLPSDAARAALDTLLIRGLDAVQRFAVANGSSDAEDGREHLAEVAARIDAEVSQMV
ncbi:MAG TPA: hypothetical protein VKA06_04055, partial [Spirochaetia bacterium]|nr:hypothetical protein [Spirochaetia bacterium]